MQTLLEYIQWWYSYGFFRMLKYLRAFVVVLADTFSVKLCIFTFLAPWKRDVTPTEGLALVDRFKIWGFNLLARLFGAFIKLITLAIFLVLFFILVCFEIIMIFLWLLLPIILVEGVVFGIMYLV